MQEKKLWEVVGPENTRNPPFEAAIYRLKVQGEKHGAFRANSTTELTIEAEETMEKEHSRLKLPVDFSEEDLARVDTFFSLGQICYFALLKFNFSRIIVNI